MPKIDLETLGSGYQSTANLNNNFQAIGDELNDKVLYRYNPSGEPNQMLNDLDMNSNRIINLVDAEDLSEPVTYRQFLDAVLNFGDPSVFQIADTAFSVDGTDFGKLYWTTSDSDVTVTLGATGSSILEDGEAVYFMQGGLGGVEFVGDSGVTVLAADLKNTRSQYSVVTAIRLSSSYWVLAGDLGLYV